MMIPTFGAVVASSLLVASISAQVPTVEWVPTAFEEGSSPVRLEMLVYRPAGRGPFPTLVFNHGSTGRGTDTALFRRTSEYPTIAEFFVNRGWMVVVPQRRGRGRSGGSYREGIVPDGTPYTCDPATSLAGVERAMADIDQAVQYLVSHSQVDSTRLLIGGQSRGGILAVAYAGTRPGRFRGVINFVGGWMSDRCPDPGAINTVTFRRGGRAGVPTLWLYGERDPYYGIGHSRVNFEAFRAAGGEGDWVQLEPVEGIDGHQVIRRQALWEGPVGRYLDRHGLVRPSQSGAAPLGSAALVIVGATVIDGTGAAPRPNSWIRIEGDRIVAVGRGRSASANGETIDARGMTVTPGLSDLHVHLGDPVRGRWILKTLLAHGVTRVKDNGNGVAALRRIREWSASDPVLPRLYLSGTLFDGSRTDLQFLSPGPALDNLLAANLELGVDFLKVHNWVSSDALRVIAAAARRHGIPLTGHVPLSVTSVAAIDAGVSILEHVRVHPFELFDDPSVAAAYPLDVLLLRRIGYWSRFTGRDRTTERTLEAWAARRDRFFLNPTLVVHEALGLGLAGLDRLGGPELVSPALRKQWPGLLPVYGRLDSAEAAEARAAAAGMGRWVGLAHRRGIRILTGTDTPLPGTPPGSSLHREIELLVSAGLTPVEAIHASTGQASAALGAADVGRIAPGQRADLVLFRGDLARDLGALRRIAHVVLGGRVLDPAVLQREATALARADSVSSGDR